MSEGLFRETGRNAHRLLWPALLTRPAFFHHAHRFAMKDPANVGPRNRKCDWTWFK
uniref:Uncharacterized protein n=1 Tax=Ralstonia solanacearum TaxID=305 RepID=A0A0S4UL26_RALSL|nr:protein of unknown function [Ralstonia solanacearum]